MADGAERYQVDFFQLIHALELAGDFERVGDDDQRDVFLAAGVANQIDDLLLVARIDVGGRLVGQEQAGPVGQGPGDGDALLLADGEGRGLVRRAVRQADAVEQVPGTRRVFAAAGERHAEQHIFERREARQQVERLKHVADLVGPHLIDAGFGQVGDVDAVDLDLARSRPA